MAFRYCASFIRPRRMLHNQKEKKGSRLQVALVTKIDAVTVRARLKAPPRKA